MTPGGPVLRDIHLPPGPGWWPPAPGWWVLAALAILLLIVAAGIVRRRRLPRRRWQLARHELQSMQAQHARHGDDADLAAGISQLLRRAARLCEADAASTDGAAWNATLLRLAPDAATAQALLDLQPAMYRPHAALDVAATADAARRWLRHVLLRGRRHA
jgi:hypothetical protein